MTETLVGVSPPASKDPADPPSAAELAAAAFVFLQILEMVTIHLDRLLWLDHPVPPAGANMVICRHWRSDPSEWVSWPSCCRLGGAANLRVS